MDKLFAARKYLSYRLHAFNAHGIHSPFVFDLYNSVINDHSKYYNFELIESLRSKHLLDERKITINDYGTGKNLREEKICDLARKALKPQKFGELLFRIANRFKPQNIIELGTSLGISTLYLSLADKNNRIVTFEGSNEIASLAQKNFTTLRQSNIELIVGSFDETLEEALKTFQKIDLAFIDGNHTKKATINYFKKILPLTNEKSILIFDDIHWSRDMEAGWKEIKENNSVTLTIDLYQVGLVFFRHGAPKQHFTLRF